MGIVLPALPSKSTVRPEGGYVRGVRRCYIMFARTTRYIATRNALVYLMDGAVQSHGFVGEFWCKQSIRFGISGFFLSKVLSSWVSLNVLVMG